MYTDYPAVKVRNILQYPASENAFFEVIVAAVTCHFSAAVNSNPAIYSYMRKIGSSPRPIKDN